MLRARNSIFIVSACLLLFGSSQATEESHSAPDPAQFKIWGPGLRSDFHMPVRYFFIQVVDKEGRNLTERLPDKFQILLRDVHNDEIISYNRILYLYNGLYVFLMRLHYSVVRADARISILYKSKLIGSSPIILKKPLYSEKCHCPHSNFTEWMERMECPKTYDQIEKDFQPFKEINMEKTLKIFLDKIYYEGSVAVCRYIVQNNQIFRKCYGKHVGFHMFSDQILISLRRKVALPDMDVLWNLGDWPLSKKKMSPLPILSWCGSTDTHDIILPTYELTESVLEMLGRTTIDLFNIMSHSTVPWSQKSNIAFFRGRDSSEERLKLVRLSIKMPEWIDARLTNMFFFPNDSSLGQLASYTSLFDFFKYKHQINMDGTVAPYRTAYLLAGGSLMLKQDSPYYEHFYPMLRPNVHFVPLHRDIEDLVDKLKWLRAHDTEARKIAENGRDFAFRYLTPQAILCYHARVFERYASRQKLPKTSESPGPGFELVTQTENSPSEKCHCQPEHRLNRDEL